MMRMTLLCLCMLLAASLAAAADGIRGKVIAPVGADISNVKVHLQCAYLEGLEASSVTSVPVDSDGSFALPEGCKQGTALATLYAIAPGEWLGARMLPWPARSLSASNDILLKRLKPLHGRLLDDSGKPLSGKTVEVSQIDLAHPGGDMAQSWISNSDCNAFLPPMQAVTDAAGRFTLPAAPPVADIRLDVMEGDLAVIGQGIRDGEVVLTAAPAGILTGTVLDVNGRPISGYQVSSYMPSREYDATTDAKGAFQIGGMLPGNYTVHPQGNSHLFKTTKVAVHAGEVAEAGALRAIPSVAISGKVSAVQDDTRARLAWVWADFPDGESSSGMVEQDGTYRLLAPKGAHVELSVFSAEGMVAEPDKVRLTADRDIEGINFALTAGPTGGGTVMGPGGQPFAGAVVQLGYGVSTATTKADGRFELPYNPVEVSDEDYVELVAEAGDLVSSGLFDLDEFASGTAVLHLEMARRVNVQVLDAQGDALAEASVRLTEYRDLDGVKDARVTTRSAGSTGPEGRATIKGLLNNVRYSISAEAPGYEPDQKFRLRAGEQPPDLVTIRMQKSERVVKGKVIDIAGKPVAGANVSQAMFFGGGISTETAADGTFRLADLPSRGLELEASADGQSGSLRVPDNINYIVLQVLPEGSEYPSFGTWEEEW